LDFLDCRVCSRDVVVLGVFLVFHLRVALETFVSPRRVSVSAVLGLALKTIKGKMRKFDEKQNNPLFLRGYRSKKVLGLSPKMPKINMGLIRFLRV
jgi:hypothetical protein